MRIIAMAFLWLELLAGAARAQEGGAGWLGAELKDLTKQEADALGWEGPRGAKLVKPVPGGPAEAAGLKPDDIFVTLDGVEIESVKALVETLSKKAAGMDIKLAIMRGGREKRLSLKLGARPAQFVATAKPAAEGPLPMLDTGGHMALIKGLAFTPDGKFIVSAGHDKVIRIWDWRAGKAVRTIRGRSGPGPEGKIFAMALSPGGRWLAVGGWTHPECTGRCGDIRLYDFASGELKALLKGHSDVIDGLAFSPDGKKLISGSHDRNAIVWDVETQTLLHRLQGHRDHIYAVGFTPDGARAVTGSFDKTLRLWRVADGALLKEMTRHGDKVDSLTVSPKDGRIASGDDSGEIRLWDSKTGAFKKVLASQGGVVGSLRFSPDGRLLLSTCGGNGCNTTQRIYDATSGKELTAYAKHDNIVIASAFSPDGSFAATGGFNGDIQVWDPKTGETKAVLKGTGRPGWAVGFSADGRSIAWGSTDVGSFNPKFF